MSEITENIKLELWDEKDTEKPLAQSPEFDYLKTVYNNFKRTDSAFGKDRQAINSEQNLLSGVEEVEKLTSTGNWKNRTWRTASGETGTRERITIEDTPNSTFQKGWRFTKTIADGTSLDICQDQVPVSMGQSYKISCFARKISGEPVLKMQYGKNPYISNKQNVESTDWQKYEFIFTVGETNANCTDGNTNIYFGTVNCVGVLEICGLRLEKVDNRIEELENENKYLKELNNSLQETVLDTQTEVAETAVVNDSCEGVGMVNIHGGQYQEIDDTKPSLENPCEIKSVENSVTIISSNKNMYQAPESIISNGVSFTKNEDDSFDIVGIATNQANTYKYVDCNDTCIKDGEIYTFSCNQALPSGLLLLCEEYENNTWKSHLFEHSLSGNTILRTKVISLKGNRIRFGLRVESGTNINVKGLKIQIEKDNKNTDIVKHKGETLIMPIQKPLKAIQDVRDSFVKKNGIWYERHYIKRAYFDGSEEWHLSGNTSNISFWGKANSIMEGLDLTKIAQTNNGSNTYLPHILSNYFKIVSLSNFFKDSICATCDYYNNNLELRLGLGLNSDITTVAQLKAKLEELSNSGNPLYVDYVLAEPELIKCTEEQSKILDKINTYKNTTIITTDNDIAKVSLKYKVDVLKAIENATAVAEQEV